MLTKSNQCRGERIYLAHMSQSQFIMKESQGSNPDEGANAEVMEKQCLLNCSPCFRIQFKTTSPGVAPYTGAVSYSMLIEKMPARSCPQTNLVESYSELRSLLPLMSVKITHLLTNTMNLLPVSWDIIMEDLTKLVWGKISWYLELWAGKAIEY